MRRILILVPGLLLPCAPPVLALIVGGGGGIATECLTVFDAPANYRPDKPRHVLFEVIAGRLQTLSPLAVLERGYSIVRSLPSREIIHDASRLRPHDRVNVKVHRGEFMARVERVGGEEEDPQPSLTLGAKGV